jgi:putative Mg2+ transporter-C (MgtC) family protein
MPFNFDLNALLRDPQVEALLRVLLAGGLSALIGLEREMEGKPAGIRTYGLVGMGAAIFTVVGIYGFGPGDYGSRVAAQIVTGIGFLGAGTILHMRRRVLGLTTAAGMWVAAGVGMAIGAGLYILGIGAAVALFLLLQFVRPERIVRARLAAAPDDGDGPTEGDPGVGS